MSRNVKRLANDRQIKHVHVIELRIWMPHRCVKASASQSPSCSSMEAAGGLLGSNGIFKIIVGLTWSVLPLWLPLQKSSSYMSLARTLILLAALFTLLDGLCHACYASHCLDRMAARRSMQVNGTA